MSKMSEPSPKRRKLQENSRGQYITIAKAGKDIDLPQNEDDEIEEVLKTRTIPVLLKDTRFSSRMIRGHFTPVARGTLPNISFAEDASPKNSVGEILKYCNGLESVHKCRQDRPPLVCSEITLTPFLDLISGWTRLHLEVAILWQDSVSVRDKVSPQYLAVLYKFQRSEQLIGRPTEAVENWNPRDFYENVHVPVDNPASSAEIVNDLMTCHLYPFQRRAVRWLLNREGVDLSSDGRLRSRKCNAMSPPPSFFETCDADGGKRT